MPKFISPLFLLVSFLFSCANSAPDIQKVNSKQEPFDHLYFSRAYPDDVVDVSEMTEIHQKVVKNIALNNKTLDPVLWRMEGPFNIGGRINTIAVDPQNTDIIFVGNSSGGVFRTGDGGNQWEPVGDDFASLSVGSIAISSQNSQVIYVGTGDPNISATPQVGNGIYKSIDGGQTWQHKGLELPKIVSRIVLDPSNDDIVYAATMGLPFERNDDRGLYKSSDGGDSWQQILYVSDEAGISDVVINPNNPSILFAASWTRIRNNTESVVYGEDAHVYRSLDGGDSWTTMTVGLPTGSQGRIGLSLAASSPDVVYSIWVGEDSQIEGVYKTDDGGELWSAIDLPSEVSGALGGFGWYFGQIRVNPLDENEITVLGVDMFSSFDGGESWEMTTPIWYTYDVHADKHDLVYVNENTMLLATDGGLYRTMDHFSSWDDIDDIPNTQFYRVNYNPHNPGVYTGGAQDNGTTSGNFQDVEAWSRDYGGDGFYPIFDPLDEQVRYATTQRGGFMKYDGFFWDDFTNGIDQEDRVNWDAPIRLSPHDNQVLYTGTYRVYKNENEFWSAISGDLTDGNIYGASFHTISTLDESPLVEGLIYVGTTDGNVRRTLDGGGSWEAIDDGLPDRYVTDIKASPVNPTTVFVTQSGYKDNDNVAHVHRSINNGDSWEDITGDLIEQPVNHIEILNDSVYFIATDYGVYMTLNSGVNWERVGENMPIIPIFDLVIDPISNRLVAATFARSIQSIDLDDLLPSTDVSVSENSKLNVAIYPNPTSNTLNLKGIKERWNAVVCTLDGKKILENQGDLYKKSIDITALASGTYLLKLTTCGSTQIIKFIVNK